MSEKTTFPYEIVDLDPENEAELHKFFPGIKTKYVKVGRPNVYLYYKTYETEGPKVYNMEVRPSDIFVMGFPKSGTSWTEEMIWLLSNDFNYDKAKSVELRRRSLSIDMSMLYSIPCIKKHLINDQKLDERNPEMFKIMTASTAELLEKMPSPRFIKSHMPLSLMPPSLLDISKVVYFTGDFKTFWELFITDKLPRTPYFPNLLQAWEKRHHPNLLILFYEEMIEDLAGSVRRVASFLGRAVSPPQLARLCDHLSFRSFKRNPAVNWERMRESGLLTDDQSFIRKGKAGEWREYFDERMTQQADRWIRDNLQGTDFPLHRFGLV